MKICSYALESGVASYGVHSEDGIRDAAETLKAKYPTLTDVLAAGALNDLNEAAAASPLIAFTSVTMLPPNPRPVNLFCIGLNYFSHIMETWRDKP